MGLTEERVDALGDDGPDIIDVQQLCWGRRHELVKLAKVARQILGGGFADVANAQRVQEPCQRRLFAARQSCKQVGGTLVRHALEC